MYVNQVFKIFLEHVCLSFVTSMSSRPKIPHQWVKWYDQNTLYPNEKEKQVCCFGPEIDTCSTVTEKILKGSANY